MGAVTKAAAMFPAPFWRDAGLSGVVQAHDGLARLVVDPSPPDGSCGVLTGFVVAGAARRLAARPPAERRAALLDTLVAAFGPRAADPIAVHEQVWTAEPHGRVALATADLARSHPGYLDGAIEAGGAATQELAAVLATAVR